MRKIIISFSLFLMVLSLSVPAFAGVKEGSDAIRKSDYQTAYREFKDAAVQGDAGAQFNLGLMYEKGMGIAKDEAEAVKWYRKAAEQGYTGAQNNLGYMYEEGRGVAKDEAEAVKWYRKAAEQGNAGAQVNLGLSYLNGMGVAKDDVEAVKWYRKAAEQGIPGAQYNMGRAYLEGRGVAKDEAEGVKWFRKVAEQGFASAQFNLGVAYEEGRGIAKDEAEAVKWYRKAAEQGNAGAQYKLGFAYANGRGIAIDDGEAVKWYRKAAEQGFAGAQYDLDTMYPKDTGTSGLAQSAAPPKIITDRYGRSENKRVEGSLAPTRIIGCIPLSKVQNTYTPPDLYRGLVACISQDNYDFAVRLSALAGIYASFDAERVADKSAGQAKKVLVMNTFEGIPQEKKTKYIELLTQSAKDPKLLGELCREIRKIGMPDYYPSYMILHGIKAFEGNPHDGALLKDFDSQKVWTNLLTKFLHCPM